VPTPQSTAKRAEPECPPCRWQRRRSRPQWRCGDRGARTGRAFERVDRGLAGDAVRIQIDVATMARAPSTFFFRAGWRRPPPSLRTRIVLCVRPCDALVPERRGAPGPWASRRVPKQVLQPRRGIAMQGVPGRQCSGGAARHPWRRLHGGVPVLAIHRGRTFQAPGAISADFALRWMSVSLATWTGCRAPSHVANWVSVAEGDVVIGRPCGGSGLPRTVDLRGGT